MATGVTYNMYFEGLRACQWAGANLERWMNGGYEKHFMATAIAMYRMDGLIEQHGQDAVGMAMEQRSKK